MGNNIFYIALSCSICWHLVWAGTVKIINPVKQTKQEFAVINFWGSIFEKSTITSTNFVTSGAVEQTGSSEKFPAAINADRGSNEFNAVVIKKKPVPLDELTQKPSLEVKMNLPKEDKFALTEKLDKTFQQRSVIFKPELPPYPDWAKSLGYEFEIELKFLILPDGTIGKIEKIKSSGYPELDEIGIRYMRKWKFMPLSKETKLESQWGVIKLNFRLQ